MTNLVRDVQSGNYYAQIRARGKLIWKSLQTDRISVANRPEAVAILSRRCGKLWSMPSLTANPPPPLPRCRNSSTAFPPRSKRTFSAVPQVRTSMVGITMNPDLGSGSNPDSRRGRGPVQIRNCALLLVAGFFFLELAFRRKKMEPRVRIELTTVRLQIGCSTAELSRLNCLWQHIVVSS